MTYKIVDAAFIEAGPGPHPAASPFDKRISEHLGVSAFEIYQVDCCRMGQPCCTIT